MCVDGITTKLNPPDPTEREGWKLFAVRDDQTLGPVFQYISDSISTNQWLTAQAIPVVGWYLSQKIEYVSGWHVFTDEASAMQYQSAVCRNRTTIRKVKYRNTTLHGIQKIAVTDGPIGTPGYLKYLTLPVHVAQEMLVIEP